MGPFRICVAFLFGVCKVFRRQSVWIFAFVSLVIFFLVMDLLTTKSLQNEVRVESGRPGSGYSDTRLSTTVSNSASLQSKESNSLWRSWKRSLVNASFWNLLPAMDKSSDSMTSNLTKDLIFHDSTFSYSLHMGPGVDLTGLGAVDFTYTYNNSAESSNKSEEEDAYYDGSALRLLVIGDYGGQTGPPYTTPIQLAVAKAMENIASKTTVHGVMSPGDNFYEDGVKNLEDPHFSESFEKVYRGHLLNKPWFTMAGNHDYTSNVTAQIAYTNISERWYFPWYNYELSWDINTPSGKGKVTILMVDTILLCGNCGLDDPLDPPHGPTNRTLAEEIWTWFENSLREASDSHHLVVVGHFPVLSGGLHGPTACLEERMLPLLHKYRVSAYITGHDHNMQHIYSSSLEYDWDVDHYVVGSGAKVEPRRTHIGRIPAHQLLFYQDEVVLEQGAGGFALMELDSAWMNFTFYNSKSHPLHRHSTQARPHRKREIIS